MMKEGENVDVLCDENELPKEGKTWILQTRFGFQRIVCVMARDLLFGIYWNSPVVKILINFPVSFRDFAHVVPQKSWNQISFI